MLRNCKGFSLIEVLASLAIWLLLCMTLVPSLLQVIKDRQDNDMLLFASRKLNEAIQGYVNDSNSMDTGPYVYKDNFLYLSWEETEGNSVKACIRWENYKKIQKERCGFARK